MDESESKLDPGQHASGKLVSSVFGNLERPVIDSSSLTPEKQEDARSAKQLRLSARDMVPTRHHSVRNETADHESDQHNRTDPESDQRNLFHGGADLRALVQTRNEIGHRYVNHARSGKPQQRRHHALQ